MAILAAEPDLFPDDLWERGPLGAPGGLDDASRPRWWCLHTKPRQEKATARHLRAHGLWYYLPQVIREGRTPGGRRTRSLIPLFSGYVFLHGDERARLEALRGNTLVQVLAVPDQEALDQDLRQVHQILHSGLAVLPEATHPIGSWVRVKEGPLQGLVGVVSRRDSGDRFVAIVRFLGQGAAVELRDWQVEAA